MERGGGRYRLFHLECPKFLCSKGFGACKEAMAIRFSLSGAVDRFSLYPAEPHSSKRLCICGVLKAELKLNAIDSVFTVIHPIIPGIPVIVPIIIPHEFGSQ